MKLGRLPQPNKSSLKQGQTYPSYSTRLLETLHRPLRLVRLRASDLRTTTTILAARLHPCLANSLALERFLALLPRPLVPVPRLSPRLESQPSGSLPLGRLHQHLPSTSLCRLLRLLDNRLNQSPLSGSLPKRPQPLGSQLNLRRRLEILHNLYLPLGSHRSLHLPSPSRQALRLLSASRHSQLLPSGNHHNPSLLSVHRLSQRQLLEVIQLLVDPRVHLARARLANLRW